MLNHQDNRQYNLQYLLFYIPKRKFNRYWTMTNLHQNWYFSVNRPFKSHSLQPVTGRSVFCEKYWLKWVSVNKHCAVLKYTVTKTLDSSKLSYHSCLIAPIDHKVLWDINSINRRCSFSSIRTDGVTVKHWSVNSTGIVRKKTLLSAYTHAYEWSHPRKNPLSISVYDAGIGCRPPEEEVKDTIGKIPMYNLFDGRRNHEEKFASQILPLSAHVNAIQADCLAFTFE